MNVLNTAAVARVTTEHAHLENWQLIRRHLVGTVSDHPDHADGETIHTSHVLTVVKDRHARTRNREYQLGSPDPIWATARTDAPQPRRGARNRCASQFDTGADANFLAFI